MFECFAKRSRKASDLVSERSTNMRVIADEQTRPIFTSSCDRSDVWPVQRSGFLSKKSAEGPSLAKF
jgi:hypothetical protein